MQTVGLNLNSETIKLATTDLGITGTNTRHRITAGVRRPLEAIFNSLEQEQWVVRTTRYASEKPSKRRQLSGKDINSPEAFEYAVEATGDGVAATSSGGCSSRELPSVKDII